jgi:hypothetical protein
LSARNPNPRPHIATISLPLGVCTFVKWRSFGFIRRFFGGTNRYATS